MSAGGASGMNSGGTGGEYQFPTECSPPLSMELGKLHATLFYGNFYYYSASSCELATVDDGDGSGVLAVVLGLDDFETVYDYRASLSPYWNWVSYSHGTPAGETFRDLEGIPEDTDIDVVAHNPDTGMRLAITFRVSRFTYTILSVSEV